MMSGEPWSCIMWLSYSETDPIIMYEFHKWISWPHANVYKPAQKQGHFCNNHKKFYLTKKKTWLVYLDEYPFCMVYTIKCQTFERMTASSVRPCNLPPLCLNLFFVMVCLWILKISASLNFLLLTPTHTVGVFPLCCAPWPVSWYTGQEQCLLRPAYLMIKCVLAVALHSVMYAGSTRAQQLRLALCL